MMNLLQPATAVALFLASYCVTIVHSSSGAANSPVESHGIGATGPEIYRITDRNIHERYAVDIIREAEFHISPEKVVELMQSFGNQVVIAPDPTKGHPNLFHMIPEKYKVMEQGTDTDEEGGTIRNGFQNPFLTVFVLKDSVSVSYRCKHKFSGVSKDVLLQFCNSWNENVKVGTAFLDKTGKLTLQHEIPSVAGSDATKEGRTLSDHFNALLLDKGMHDFQISLQRFGKKLVGDIMLKHQLMDLSESDKETLRKHADSDDTVPYEAQVTEDL